jgi:hypothetical protein
MSKKKSQEIPQAEQGPKWFEFKLTEVFRKVKKV